MNYLSLFYFIFTSLMYQFVGCNNSDATTADTSSSSIEIKAAQEEMTTLIFVRHAEKDTVKGDPVLTKIGHERAEDLARMLSDVPLAAIYSTDYKRTKQTAQPTAEDKQLSITIYNHRDLNASANEILSKYKGEAILIVGHSNSTPTFVNTILGEQQYAQIDEKDYDNIFIVKASKIGSAEALHLHYGK